MSVLRRMRDLSPTPTVAWITYLFLVLPSVIVIPISFGGSGEMLFPPRILTLELYRQFMDDPTWWGALLQSLRVAACAAILTTVLGVPATYALHRTSMKGRGLVNGLVMGPLIVPVVVIGLGLYLQMAPYGWTNSTVSLVLAHTMLALPFLMISVGTAMRHLDHSYEKVALIMGASRIRIFFRVVLPQLKSGIAAGALFAFLISLDEVIVAYFITANETQTLPVKMFSALRWEVSPVIAAVSTLLTIVSVVFAAILMWLDNRSKLQ